MTVATIIGSPASPYVRKVMVVCDLKGVRFRDDPIIPFQGNDAFSKLSPLRRVPVLIDDQVTLADSTAICEYLEERYPDPPVFPKSAAARGHARWLEEFADTRMGDVFVWRIFGNAVVRPGVWKEPRDEAAIAAALRDDLPEVMEYLETVAPAEGFIGGGNVGVADIAVAAHFPALRWSRVVADLSAWPRATAWVARVAALPALAKYNALGERFLSTRVAERPGLFDEFGVELTETTYAGPGFRRGPMSV
jgi:glutathione S-transferase